MLLVFYITQIQLRKAWIHLFSFQWWENSWPEWVFSLGKATSLKKKNSEFKPVLLCLKITMYHTLLIVEQLGKYIHFLSSSLSSYRASSTDIPDPLATFPYRSSPLAGLQGYILYPHIAAVYMF